MVRLILVIVASAISFLGGVGYAVDTFQGKTRPNRVSWFLWTLAPSIAFAGEISQRANIQALLTLVLALGTGLGFAASFVNRKAYWRVTTFDLVCGSISLLALVLWLTTGNGNFAILFSILADFFAAVPTIVKSYTDPQSESYNAYAANSFGSFITLLTIQHWTIANFAFPLYLTITMGLITLLVLFPNVRFAAR